MSENYQSILLTGAGGFVARRLIPAIADRYPNAERTALSRRQLEPCEGWHLKFGDLTDRSSIDTVVRDVRPDLVVHLAAHSAVSTAAMSSSEVWATNSIGSLFLAEAIARHSPSATVLFTSSGEVYGRTLNSGPAAETSPIWPEGPYSGSKAAAEKILDSVLMEARLITVRSFNHTGPGQDERFVIPSFAAQIARIEAGLVSPKIMIGNLEAERDFLDVQDVVDAYLALLEANLQRRTVVNLSSGRAYKIQVLFELMRAHSTARFDVEVDPDRLRRSDIPRSVGDASLLKSLTDWKVKQPIDETVLSVLDYWRRKIAESSQL